EVWGAWVLVVGATWTSMRSPLWGGGWDVWRSPYGRVVPLGVRLLEALIWIAVPVALHLRGHRALRTMGLALTAPQRSLALVARYAAATLLPFVALAHLLPAARSPAAWGATAGAYAGAVARYVLIAGLPEEVFYRGFVQPLVAARLPGARRRVLGVALTPAVVLTAALFAVTHLVWEVPVQGARAWMRLLTFFPGLLFGALREDTGDIAASVAYHALCDATLEVAAPHLYAYRF